LNAAQRDSRKKGANKLKGEDRVNTSKAARNFHTKSTPVEKLSQG